MSNCAKGDFAGATLKKQVDRFRDRQATSTSQSKPTDIPKRQLSQNTLAYLRTSVLRGVGRPIGPRARHHSRVFSLSFRTRNETANLPRFFQSTAKQRRFGTCRCLRPTGGWRYGSHSTARSTGSNLLNIFVPTRLRPYKAQQETLKAQVAKLTAEKTQSEKLRQEFRQEATKFLATKTKLEAKPAYSRQRKHS